MRVISHKRLLSLVTYDADTGIFTRNGKPWGTEKEKGGRNGGYLIGTLDGRIYRLSRLAWFYVTKQWPPRWIDHINRNRSDDRFSNLRLSNKFQNGHNRPKNKNNKSGFKGVSFCKYTKRWRATISANGSAVKTIGRFNTKAEAYRAYQNAATTLHGEFSHAP